MHKHVVILVAAVLFLTVQSILSQQWKIPVNVSDGINNAFLKFGIHPNGTNGFDAGLDTLAPPPPPAGAFDTRLTFNFEDYITDIRSNTLDQKIFTMTYRSATGANPIVLTWNNANFSALGTFIITDNITGTLFTLDMTTTNTLAAGSNPLLGPGIRILVTPNALTLPTANFSGTPTGGIAPLTVNFTDLSIAGTGTITSWLWDFGDGATSTTRNPVHTYAVAGNYTVTLQVTDNLGQSDIETKTNYITVTSPIPPTANFTGSPTSGFTPLTVNFNDLSIAGSGIITSWYWDFGDGGSSTSQNPSHTYITAGTFTVSLTVTNSSGQSDTETKNNYISATAAVQPTANFSGSPTSGFQPLTVNFTDLSFPGSGTIISWLWNFGDGSSSTSQNPSHVYSSAGNYTVSLTVTDNLGQSDTETKINYITVNAVTQPVANFSGSPTSGFAPLTVQFTDQSTPVTGTIIAWAWNFGDGSTSSSQNPIHIYSSAGSYTVSLMVTDNLGLTDIEVKTAYITVNIATPPTSNFSGTPTNGLAPLTVNFSDLSTAGTGTINSWTWNFGDGATSTVRNPVHTYNTGGNYTVSLTVTDNLGFSDTETKNDYISVLISGVVSSLVPSNDTPAPGGQITVDVNFDLRGMPIPNNLLGSFSGSINWNPAILVYADNSGLQQGFTGIVNVQNTASGEITFNGLNVSGVGGRFNVLTITFNVIGPSGSTTQIDLAYSAMSSAYTFFNLLNVLTVYDATITVTEPVNQPPVITAIPTQMIGEGSTLDVLLSASDPDNNDLFFSVNNLPVFGNLVDNGNGTGYITFLPDYNSAGNYAGIEVIVSDNGLPSLSDTVQFTLQVDEANPPAKLLITEIMITPTAAEFIEIFNPNNFPVFLGDYYITDATFASGNTFYYQIVQGGGGGGNFSDFNARFPDGAIIQAGEYQTIALAGDSLFYSQHGVLPTYELYEDGTTFTSDVPEMREATPGSINNQGGLSNNDEVVILYYWNRVNDLVKDVDYLIYNSSSPLANDEAVDKTGIGIDGPDLNLDSLYYLPDTPVANQLSAPNHTAGYSLHRIDLNEGLQSLTGGNGVNGADETSEDLNHTFSNRSIPSPNTSYQPLLARLQVIHNSADPAVDSVDIYLNGNLVIPDLKFRQATPYLDIPAGIPINIGIAPGNSTSIIDTLRNFILILTADESYVAIATGVLNPAGFAPNPDGFNIQFTLVLKSGAREVALGNEVEFFGLHGVTDAGYVDIRVQNGTTLLNNVHYGELNDYLVVPPAVYNLEVTDSSQANILFTFPNVDLSGLGSQTAVLIASGFLAPSANQNGANFVLLSVLADGSVTIYDMLTDIEPITSVIPVEFSLAQNYPNPFNPSTTIAYSLKERIEVRLRIYNLLGQEVRTLVNQIQEAGKQQVVWNGLNNDGVPVASGIYLYQLTAGEFVQIRKMVLMK